MAKYKLTVAIPTYNRPRELAHTLSVVLPQILSTDNVQLIVLDNASQVSAVEVLKNVSDGKLLPERIKIIRHSYNIGGNANILRCFEVAEGEWLWCLGDDDEPQAAAVKTILADAQDGTLCYLYYGCSRTRLGGDGQVVDTDIRRWAQIVPAYGHRLFISNSVFKLSAVRPYYSVGVQVSASGAPHLAMAFLSVLHGGQFLLSSKQLAFYVAPDKGVAYSCVGLAYGCHSLLSLATDERQSACWKSFFKEALADWISPYLLLYQVIAYHHGDADLVRFGFKMIKRLFEPCFFSAPGSYLRWQVCGLLAHFPSFYAWMVCQRMKICQRTYATGDLSRG